MLERTYDSLYWPFEEQRRFAGQMRQLHEELNRMFGGFTPVAGNARTDNASASRGEGFSPKLDYVGTDTAYTVTLELPGVKAGDVSIELRDNHLIISGEKKHELTEGEQNSGCYRVERSYGTFRRVLNLPDDADQEKISAEHKDGVLKIAIPRREAVQTSRKIEITA